MATSRSIYDLDHQTAFDGINIRDIPGDPAAIGPEAIWIIWGASDLPPGMSVGILGYPGGAGANGVDNNGNISCSMAFQNTGDDIHFNTSEDVVEFLDGFWNTLLRIDIGTTLGTRWFYIQFGGPDPNDPAEWPGTPPPPTRPNKPVITQNAQQIEDNELKVSWTSGSPDIADDTGYYIEYQYDGNSEWWPAASIPVNPTTFPAHEVLFPLDDFITPPTEIIVVIRTYNYGPPKTITLPSDPSDPFFPAAPPPGEEEIPPTPTIEIPPPGIPTLGPGGTLIGDGYGGFNLGGTATMVFIQNPSGIYTLVKNKRHDTLYERMTGITSVDVKIPDPFVRTGFVGE